MSSLESSDIPALPTPEVYAAFYENYEEQMVERQNEYNTSVGAPLAQWDAWTDVMKYVGEVQNPSHRKVNKELPQQLMILAQLSSALEMPRIENDRLQVQYAFGYGFLQQQRIINTMYRGAIAFSDTFTPVAATINTAPPFETVEALQQYLCERVKALGRAGLLALEDSQQYINRWAQEVYTPATYQYEILQDIFRMGHGVAIYGARSVHQHADSALKIGDIDTGDTE